MSEVVVLDESEVLSRLNRDSVIEALETAFAGLVTGRSVQPAQTVTVFPDGRGDCIFYPGVLYDLGLVGVKVSPYLQELADAGKYPVTAYTLLLSVSDGRPLLLCDSYALTSIRTAATTALALKYLVGSDAKTLAVVGTGKLGREHLAYATRQRGWAEVRVYSPTAVTAGARRDLVVEAGGKQVSFAATCEQAVQGADVVMLCTSSGSSVVERQWVKDGALVTSISTNSPGAHEIEPSTLSGYDVYCDYRATAPVTAGEMKIAIEDRTWSADAIIADLPELASGHNVAFSERPRFFRSTGLGIEDLTVAGLLVQ